MKKILALALLTLTLAAGSTPSPSFSGLPAKALVDGRAVSAPAMIASPPPSSLWLDRGDIRDLARDGGRVWAATSGGLVAIDLATLEPEQRTFEGLDTLDVRRVHAIDGRVVVVTAFSRCTLVQERFECHAEPSDPAEPHETEFHAGRPVTVRLQTERGEFIGTRGAGLWLGKKQIVEGGAGSFAKAAAISRKSLYVGLFDGGIVKAPLEDGNLPNAPKWQAVVTPFRMVNDLLDVDGSLFVAANEGLYVSHDGKKFERVLAIGAKSITGLAADDTGIWLTSSESLYKIDRAAKKKAQEAYVHPAGSRSVQGLALVKDGIWLATEDRGAIFFDGKEFHAKDKLAGLPTSWMVGVTSDREGGVFASTLRDGALRVRKDGSWDRVRSAGAWGQTQAVIADHACFGTQEGASCGAIQFKGLPDPRVHVMMPVGRKILIGTEAGIAVYDRG